jgi:hypothetical protein
MLLRTVAGLLIVALAVQAATPVAARPISRAEYEACQARDEQAFRTAIETLTQNALTAGLAKIDYPAVVAQEWRRVGLDQLIDKQVDTAIGEVREESSWGTLLQSLASREKAQQLATTAAERVYRSDAIKTALEDLATGVGKEVGRTLELSTLDAAEPALECLQAFLGPRYGSTVAKVVAVDAGKEFQIDPAKGGANVSAGAVLVEGREAIAGAAVLLVRRQISGMAARIGQRLVGSVLSRLVSVVAGGVGIALIAKDIWDFRHGVLPIIADEMKSQATKDKVEEELARSIAAQISEHSREISMAAADRIVEIWREFRRGHAKVLDLAEQNEEFRRFLDTLQPADLPRLDEVVALVLASEGEAGLMRRLKNGTLQQAVTKLPAPSMEIARDTRSLEMGLAWTALAGPTLAKVVELGLHKRATAQDFSKASLERLLSLGDALAIVRLAGIERGARDRLLELDNAELRGLARGLAEPELETLSRYLTGLEPAAGQRVLRAVAQSPGRMRVLASARVRDAVLSSPDQLAAVAMMLRADSGFDPFTIKDDLVLAYEGRINPILLWDKHPVAVSIGAIALLLLLFVLRRLLFGPRRTRMAYR